MRNLPRFGVAMLALLVAIGLQSTASAATREPIQNRAHHLYVTAMTGLADGYTAATAIAEARGELGMICPVPSATFVSSFGAPRTGHTHQGVDMMADFGTQVLAPEAGLFEGDGESFYLHADSGTTYFGTHNGGDLVASGSRVTRGQPISTVSNTGNASGRSPHLHFEIHPGDGPAVDPYPATLTACSVQIESAPIAQPRTMPRVTADQIRFCRYVVGNIGPRFVGCLHEGEGHHQGMRGHLWADYVRQARQFHRFLTGLAPRSCSGPADCPALIRAAFDYMGVGYRGSEAVAVATCESGLNPSARGGGGGNYAGLFQQSLTYWPERAARFGMAGASVYDPWANSVVSAGMVRDDGDWGQWACSP